MEKIQWEKHLTISRISAQPPEGNSLSLYKRHFGQGRKYRASVDKFHQYQVGTLRMGYVCENWCEKLGKFLDLRPKFKRQKQCKLLSKPTGSWVCEGVVFYAVLKVTHESWLKTRLDYWSSEIFTIIALERALNKISLLFLIMFQFMKRFYKIAFILLSKLGFCLWITNKQKALEGSIQSSLQLSKIRARIQAGFPNWQAVMMGKKKISITGTLTMWKSIRVNMEMWKWSSGQTQNHSPARGNSLNIIVFALTARARKQHRRRRVSTKRKTRTSEMALPAIPALWGQLFWTTVRLGTGRWTML